MENTLERLMCSQEKKKRRKPPTRLEQADGMPKYQLKQEVPILWSFRVSWQKRKAVYIHADKYKISNFSTHCNFVSLITLQCLFVGATWEACVNDTNLRQVLLVIRETHLSVEEMEPWFTKCACTHTHNVLVARGESAAATANSTIRFQLLVESRVSKPLHVLKSDNINMRACVVICTSLCRIKHVNLRKLVLKTSLRLHYFQMWWGCLDFL